MAIFVNNGGIVMKTLLTVFVSSFTLFFTLYSGTITFKDGTRISEAEIVSIKDGRVVVKKDKKERTFELKSIESFYETDLADGSNAIPGKFSDYKVSVVDVKMPSRGKNKDGEKESCEIKYLITKTDAQKNKIKFPYFYLYVLSTPDKEDGERKVYSYYYPDDAKVKSKGGYDEAAIMKKVLGFDRRIVDYEEAQARSSMKNMGDRDIKIELDGINNRKIIAYHLEVWGNEKKVAEKVWKDIDHKIGDHWWERDAD